MITASLRLHRIARAPAAALFRAAAVFLSAAVLILSVPATALAATSPGLWLTTDYPAMAVRAGDTTTVKISLRNAGLSPQRVALAVEGVPKGWRATLLGGGVPVTAAMPSPNEVVPLQLRLEVPAGANKGSQRLVVTARGSGTSAELPLEFNLGQSLPARLSIKSKLPSQRGSARTSFEFPFTLHNESDRDMVVKLDAQVPAGFQVSFSENYGTQEISSIPIEAGQNKELKAKVQPPETAPAGEHPLTIVAAAEGAQAAAKMSMQLTGAPQLKITTESGRLSGEAEIGSATPLNVVLENTGAAPANDITLSSTPPGDWKIEFEPNQIPALAPGEKLPVQALVTPSNKAIAGDYMATLRANSGNESASADFRITVTTSTLWGVVGLVVIAIALLLSVGAVARFGRR